MSLRLCAWVQRVAGWWGWWWVVFRLKVSHSSAWVLAGLCKLSNNMVQWQCGVCIRIHILWKYRLNHIKYHLLCSLHSYYSFWAVSHNPHSLSSVQCDSKQGSTWIIAGQEIVIGVLVKNFRIHFYSICLSSGMIPAVTAESASEPCAAGWLAGCVVYRKTEMIFWWLYCLTSIDTRHVIIVTFPLFCQPDCPQWFIAQLCNTQY